MSTLKPVIEALLMASSKPLSVAKIHAVLEKHQQAVPYEQIREILTGLAEDYAGRGIQLQQVASGFRFQVCEGYAGWVNTLLAERPPRYSRALLETLAIIAYRQPVTRGQIEEIRGVNVSSNIIKTLNERGWIRVVGHRDVPGKPALLGTTKDFLDYFNLHTLSELPPLAALTDVGKLALDPFSEQPEADIEQVVSDDSSNPKTGLITDSDPEHQALTEN